jgi:hypothetical protein
MKVKVLAFVATVASLFAFVAVSGITANRGNPDASRIVVDAGKHMPPGWF